MPNIIACYKWVLDEQDIKINPENFLLDTTRAKHKISDYDRNVLEEALLIKEKAEGTITALTFGTAAAKQSLKDVLSRGPEKAVFVKDESAAGADAFVTANVLAAAIRKIDDVDIILCGEGSSDTYAQQVGPRLAALLGMPAITYVSQLSIEAGKVAATRKLGDCTEVVTASFPVIITLLPEINNPRIPSLKQVMAASKKPTTEWSVSDLGLSSAELTPRVTVKEIKGYIMRRKRDIYKTGSAAEKVANLVRKLTQEGVLP